MIANEILLSRMYVGNYLNSENNIGHEIINLFKADDDNNYIYVNPYGTMSKEHNNKIKTILLVRYCGNCTMEILAKAVDLEQIAFVNKSLTDKERLDIHNSQIKYIDRNNITYGGLKQYNIYKNNLHNETAAYITFKANDLIKPIKPIYISARGCKNYEISKENYFHLGNDYIFSNQSLKMYLSPNIGKQKEAFEKLENIINNNSLWERENTTPKVKVDFPINENTNFLKIIQKENDELVFSNLFKYFFEYNAKAFCKFASDVLKISNFEQKFCINREVACDVDNDRKIDGYIDLLIWDKANTIVIENKIKSGINGCSDRHDVESEQVQSQLKYYYNFVENLEGHKNHTKKYFIFAPNYNRIDKSNYACSEFYTIINFSEIYNWFKDNSESYYDNRYFEDFLNALYKHTKSVDNSQEEEMHRRFVNVIKSSM